jgi:hypothetical protein
MAFPILTSHPALVPLVPGNWLKQVSLLLFGISLVCGWVGSTLAVKAMRGN